MHEQVVDDPLLGLKLSVKGGPAGAAPPARGHRASDIGGMPRMLIVTGQLDRITEREAGSPGRTWTEHTLVVRDWGSTTFLTVGRDFGPLPSPGDRIAVEVTVRPYMGKSGPGYGYTALRPANLDAQVDSARISA